MKKKLFICSIFAVMSLCTFITSAQEQRQMPSVDIKTFKGSTINASTINNDGKPMIVVAWELSCRTSLAQFNAIAREYESWQKETGVKIVAISIDDGRNSPKVQSLVRSRGWDFEVYLDPNQAFKRAMNVSYCPFLYLLNDKGQVVWQKGGYSPGDEKIVIDMVRKVAKGESIE